MKIQFEKNFHTKNTPQYIKKLAMLYKNFKFFMKCLKSQLFHKDLIKTHFLYFLPIIRQNTHKLQLIDHLIYIAKKVAKSFLNQASFNLINWLPQFLGIKVYFFLSAWALFTSEKPLILQSF